MSRLAVKVEFVPQCDPCLRLRTLHSREVQTLGSAPLAPHMHASSLRRMPATHLIRHLF